MGGSGGEISIKVLHVVPSLALRHGGVSISIRQLCQGLSRRGIQVEIWTTQRGYDPTLDDPMDQSLKISGVKLRCFPVHPWRWLGGGYAYSPLLRLSLQEEIRRFDLIHIHGMWLFPTFVASRLCGQFGIPYVVSPCGMLDPYGFRLHTVFKWTYGFLIERGTLKGARLIHFTSPLEKQRAFRFGVKSPTTIVPCSLNPSETPTLPAGLFRVKYPEIGGRRILLFLGRLHPKKRLDQVAQIFAMVAQQREDVHLVLAGPDEGGVSSAHTILERKNLLGRVTFTGLVSGQAKWEIYRDSDFFLLPSEDENFALTALEAMAMGVPVLVSKGVGLSDWIEKGKAGLVLENDPSIWADAIGRLLDDSKTRQLWRENGRRLVETTFSTDRVAAAMAKAYGSLL